MEKSLGQLMNEMNLREQVDINYSDRLEVETLLEKMFPGIKPTDKENFNGRLKAYELAALRIKEEEKEKDRQRRRDMITGPWTYQQMKQKAIECGSAIGAANGFQFEVLEHLEEAFHLLCLYFTNDPEFEENHFGGVKYSLKKGIWLQSGVRGVGKSTLLQAFKFNKRACYGYKHTKELANIYSKYGYDQLDKFIGPQPISATAMNFYQTECGFMYDELFNEQPANHFGSPLKISEYIINKLYDFSDNSKGKRFMFHCTSNCDGPEIESQAGINYRSRMAEMFNLIKIEGPDLRKG